MRKPSARSRPSCWPPPSRSSQASWPSWWPEAEVGDLIVEVRSATAGVGSFTFKFDHMAELTGRTADQIVAARKAAAA